MRSTPSPTRARGFTLVELLVVIGIIAVLIAILMPALTKARKDAAVVVCADHLRQLTAGLFVYANEYDGWLPFDDESGNPGTIFFWQRFSLGAGLPYIPGQYHGTIWTCPMIDLGGFGPANYYPTRWDAQYSLNYNLDGWGSQTLDASGTPTGPFVWAAPPHKLQEAGANTIVLGDGHVWWSSTNHWFYFVPQLNANLANLEAPVFGDFAPWCVNPATGTVTTLHDGVVNVSFGDGHVESLRALTPAMFALP